MSTTATAAAPAGGSLQVDTQHQDVLHDAQVDYYGSKLATCSSDRTVRIFNLAENASQLSATLTGHSGPVWQVSWAHPRFGIILASCSMDGSVLIYKCDVSGSTGSGHSRRTSSSSRRTTQQGGESWQVIHQEQQLHASSVNAVAFAPNEYGLMLAAAGADGKVSVLSLDPPSQSWSKVYLDDNSLGVNGLSWASYGAYSGSFLSESEQANAALYNLSSPRLVTAGCDSQIRFWVQDATTQEWKLDSELGQLDTSSGQGHSDWVRDVAWAPTLLPNSNRVASCGEDGLVLLWTQNLIQGSASKAWTPTVVNKFDEPVWRVSWSETGHLLAVSSGDDNVTLWKADVTNGIQWTQVPANV